MKKKRFTIPANKTNNEINHPVQQHQTPQHRRHGSGPHVKIIKPSQKDSRNLEEKSLELTSVTEETSLSKRFFNDPPSRLVDLTKTPQNGCQSLFPYRREAKLLTKLQPKSRTEESFICLKDESSMLNTYNEQKSLVEPRSIDTINTQIGVEQTNVQKIGVSEIATKGNVSGSLTQR